MDQDQNQPQATPKQQVIERVRAAMNVLVTVRSNPTVDELSACIGLTLMLNKLGKHATAVFSGQVPSTLEFLKPEDTLETNTDSLRDFIVSLDKSKADKLRYKVEENVVKIFITPYRTSISEKDLEFTQGDFNVDVVLALGVTVREELDQAITAHGRILHDATVVTVTAGQHESQLGAINWQEAGASSLSEMLVSISEAFQGGIIDSQMATAFLTGIVSETERFSNPKTTPKVMTMAAQLMAAGANQQLIANELQRIEEVPLDKPVDLQPETAAKDQPADDGSLSISHEDDEDKDDGEPPAPPRDELEPPRDDDGGHRFLPPLPPSEDSKSFEPLLSPDVHDHPQPEQPDQPPQSGDIFAPLDNPVEHNADAEGNQVEIDGNGNVIKPDPPIQPKHKSIQPLSELEPQLPPEPNLEEQMANLSTMLKSKDPFADDHPEISDVKVTEADDPLPEAAPAPEMDKPTLPNPEPEQPAPELITPEQPAPEPAPEFPIPPAPAPVEPMPAPPAPEPPAPAPMPDMPPPPAPVAPAPAPSTHEQAEIPDETTLLEIEQSVNSPHLQLTGETEHDSLIGVDSARDAVQEAINQAGYDALRPGARNDLNAQPLGNVPPAPATEPAPQPVLNGFDPSVPPAPGENHDNGMPPPPVPPPLMPMQ